MNGEGTLNNIVLYTLVTIFVRIDPCAEVNCGKHATCRIEGTEAFCVCDEGWTYNPKKISAGCIGKAYQIILLTLFYDLSFNI